MSYQDISDFFTHQSANGLAPLLIRNTLFHLETIPDHPDKSRFTQKACVSAIHTTAPESLKSSLINTNSTVIARLNKKSTIEEFVHMLIRRVHKVRLSPILATMQQKLQELQENRDEKKGRLDSSRP